jgi:hypothetical protein
VGGTGAEEGRCAGGGGGVGGHGQGVAGDGARVPAPEQT